MSPIVRRMDGRIKDGSWPIDQISELEDLPDEEMGILSCFLLLPNIHIPEDYLKKWMGGIQLASGATVVELLNRLHEEGWLKRGTISLQGKTTFYCSASVAESIALKAKEQLGKHISEQKAMIEAMASLTGWEPGDPSVLTHFPDGNKPESLAVQGFPAC